MIYHRDLREMCACLNWVRQLTKRWERAKDNDHYWHVREACVRLCRDRGHRISDLVKLHQETSGLTVKAMPSMWHEVAPPELLVSEVLES